MTEYLWHGSGEVEEKVVGAELGNDAELSHEELSVMESHHECLVNKMFRDSAQCLQDRGQVFQDDVEFLAVWSVRYR